MVDVHPHLDCSHRCLCQTIIGKTCVSSLLCQASCLGQKWKEHWSAGNNQARLQKPGVTEAGTWSSTPGYVVYGRLPLTAPRPSSSRWPISRMQTLSQGSRLQLCHQPSSPSRDKVTSVTDPAKDLKAKTVAHPHTQLVLINVLPNANKDPRPILDRRRLNMHLKVCPLQIRCTVTPGEWFTFIDLKDSYFDS